MQAQGHQLVERRVGRGFVPMGDSCVGVRRASGVSALVLCSFAVAGCSDFSLAIERNRVAQIGKETASGTVESDGRAFGFVYRRKGTPLSLQLASYHGRKSYEMAPALWDDGVPIIEIFSVGQKLDKSDEGTARAASVVLCEKNPKWREESVSSMARDGEFDDFLNEGVWSFVQECK